MILKEKCEEIITDKKLAYELYSRICDIEEDPRLVLLEEQEGKVTVPFSWLVKFCSHIDFKEPMSDLEREQAWRKKLKMQFGIDV